MALVNTIERTTDGAGDAARHRYVLVRGTLE